VIQVRTAPATDGAPTTVAAARSTSTAPSPPPALAASQPAPAPRPTTPAAADPVPAPSAPPPPDGQVGSDDGSGSANPAHRPPGVGRGPTRLRPPLAAVLGHGASKQRNDMLAEADKALEAGDLDRANAVATQVVAQAPSDARALGVLALTACARGDQAGAQGYYDRLPAVARGKVKASCPLSLEDSQ